MQTDRNVVLTTCESDEEATIIAAALVDRKLAACVQALPIKSTFYWEGEVQHDSEVLVLVKTTADRTEAAVTAIQELHSYDLPEVIVLPITGGSQEYLGWIQEVMS